MKYAIDRYGVGLEKEVSADIFYNKYIARKTLIILNKGPKAAGFMVCMDCRAAVPGYISISADFIISKLQIYCQIHIFAKFPRLT